jgi:MFS family permease
MRLLISFAALFISIALVQLGSGTLGPLDALSGAALGFSTREIGLLGSAHFAGFFIGCIATPMIMGRVGHSRAFAAFAAIGAVGALLHPLVQDPYAWAAMRVLSGASVAGCYTIVESWLQAKADNSNRGRISSVYRTVDLIASLLAQMMVGFLDPATYVSYNIVACFLCFCLLPLTLTTAVAPSIPARQKISLFMAIKVSPLGAAGVVTVGLTNSSFRMVGPVYGNQNGLTPYEVGLFLASALAGGALAQPFVGWIADKFDRRIVLIIISALALCVCGFISTRPDAQSFEQLAIASFLFGATAFPLYSISAAHANDYATPESVVELNASLMVLYGVGAIVSPLVASELITLYGPSAMFLYIGAAHVALIVFSLYRMTRRKGVDAKTPYTYRPRTSFVLERLLGRKPDK